jgi:TRAP-type C4-dicarboxylate transport system substrate-binding protein
MVTLSRSALAALAVGGAIFLPGCASGNKSGASAEQHVTVLKLANFGGGIDPSLQVYADAVHRLSLGTLSVEIGSNYRLGDPRVETDTIRDVRSGRAQLAWVGARAWDTVGVNSFRALVAPLLIDSYPLQQRVLANKPIVHKLLASLRPQGLVGLAVLPGPFKRIASRKPLLGPTALADVTFAVTPTGVARATARALGANPAVLIPNEHNLPKKVGAVEGNFQSIYGNQYFRRYRYLTRNLVLWPRPLVVFANRKLFNSLSHPQQQALRLAGADVIAKATTAARTGDNGVDAAASLCLTSVHEMLASPADLAALRRAVAPVYTWLDKDPQTRSLVAQIESLKRRLAVPPDAGPPCTLQVAAVSKPTPLDGVYVNDVTRQQEATREGVAPSQVLTANFGHSVTVLDRGHYAGTQENGRVCTWNYGTYKVVGDKYEVLVSDGGGVGTQSFNVPGEYFVYRWSLYRDTLTVNGVPFGRRVSTTPSTSLLSKRCPPPRPGLSALR